jgi:hypothetical protein
VLDATGVMVTQIDLPDGEVSNPDIAPAGATVWITGGSLRNVSDSTPSVLATGSVGEPAGSGRRDSAGCTVGVG